MGSRRGVTRFVGLGLALTFAFGLGLVAACAADDDDEAAPAGSAAALPDAAPAIDGSTSTDAGAASDAPSSDAAAVRPLPALPLRTDGRWIVDAHGKRFKLASVNWYGAEESDFVVAGLDHADVHAIARFVAASGFNSVRLPWSNQLVETNPIVADARLAANPALRGKTALDVLDAVVDALAAEGVVVILDDHTSSAGWCCSTKDGNGLWYTAAYPESSWLADWRTMVARYRSRPSVVGADLRNELRPVETTSGTLTPAWGASNAALDWRAAAARGGEAVLAANPDLLVVVEGLNYSNDLGGVYDAPLTLSVPHRLVYPPHDYSFDHAGLQSYDQLATILGERWGFIITQGKPFTAPLWVGEFGTVHDAADVDASTGAGLWFESLRRYLAVGDVDWSYWALNGTEANGAPVDPSRTTAKTETYGILDTTWTAAASSDLLGALRSIEKATQGP